MIFFYLLISVMPLSHHPLWTRFMGELTVIKYLGGACVLYALVYLLIRQRIPPVFSTWQARLFLTFYLIVIVSYFTEPAAVGWQLSSFMTYTSFLLLFLIMVTVVDSVKRVRWVTLTAIGSVALASLYVLREWQKFHDVYRNFRPGWVVGDPNYFTVSSLVALPMALYLILVRRPLWERFFCLVCLVVTFLAVMVAASRGGFLGLMAAFAVVLWHSKQRVRNLVMASVLLIPISLLAPSSPVRRFLHPVRGDMEGEQKRLVVWKAGLRMIADAPLLGIGLGNFKPVVPEYEDPSADMEVETVAHNAYVEVAAELGLPALFLFVGILYFSYRSLGRTRRLAAEHGPPLLQQVALGLQAGVAGCAVAIFFVSGQYQKLLWATLILSMCSPFLPKNIGQPASLGELHRLTVDDQASPEPPASNEHTGILVRE